MTRRQRRIAITLGAMFGVGLVGYLTWYGIAARELAQEWDKAAKLGLVKTSAELNGEVLPDSANAATEFKAAAEELKRAPKAAVQALYSDPATLQPEMKSGKAKPYVPPSKVEIERAYASLASTFSHLRKGANQAGYYANQDWEQPWESGFNSVLPPANTLVKSAFWRAYYGEFDGALADLAVVRRIAAIAERQPSLDHRMAGIRLEVSADRTAVMIAFHHRQNPRALAKVRAFLEVPANDFEFADTMAVEAMSMAWGARMLGEDPKKIGLKDDDLSIYQLPLRLAPYNMAQQARLVRICRETYERYHGRGRDFISMLKELAETEPKKAADWQWNDVIDSYYPKLDYTYDIQVGASAQVRRQLGLVALDVIEAYGKTGQFPAQLPASANMSDPFTGKPLRFAIDKNRFVLYSAGVDGKNGSPDEYTHRPDYDRHWSLWIPVVEDPISGIWSN